MFTGLIDACGGILLDHPASLSSFEGHKKRALLLSSEPLLCRLQENTVPNYFRERMHFKTKGLILSHLASLHDLVQ